MATRAKAKTKPKSNVIPPRTLADLAKEEMSFERFSSFVRIDHRLPPIPHSYISTYAGAARKLFGLSGGKVDATYTPSESLRGDPESAGHLLTAYFERDMEDESEFMTLDIRKGNLVSQLAKELRRVANDRIEVARHLESLVKEGILCEELVEPRTIHMMGKKEIAELMAKSKK
jgi:hypothetical protein